MKTHTPPAGRDHRVGDEYRERLTDLAWVAGADAVQLRVALHALSWRCSRSTVDAFASDPEIARRVLIVARGIRDELNARIDADEESGKGLVPLLRRRATIETVITTCDAAVRMADPGAENCPGAGELLRAIARHERAIPPEDARDADWALWRVLDNHAAAS